MEIVYTKNEFFLVRLKHVKIKIYKNFVKMTAGFDIGERFEKYKLVFLGDLSTGKTSIIN